MKTLALLGGMTYHATAIYYTRINDAIQKQIGGATSAPLLLHSFNHAETQKLFNSGLWDDVITKFVNAASNLKNAGADGLMICCNIGHKVALEVEKQVGLPLLHIADPTGKIIKSQGITKIALIGTKPVMEDDFLAGRLRDKFGLEVLVPGQDRRDQIHKEIMGDLARNVVTKDCRDMLLDTVKLLVGEGAQGVVFACTELQFAVKPSDIEVPLWDTMDAHIGEAAKWILSQ